MLAGRRASSPTAWSRTRRAWASRSCRAAISARSWSSPTAAVNSSIKLVALGVVEVVLVLLDVGQAALQLGQPAGTLGGRQVFQFLQQVLLPFEPAADRLVDGHRRTGESPLEDGPGQGHARLLATARLREELVDVGGDRLVEVVLLRRFSLNATVCACRSGNSRRPSQVAEVFLQPPQRPRAIRAEPEDVAADLGRLVADAVRLGEQVGVDQADEVGEAVVVAVVRGRRQQEQVVGVGGQPLGELVALGLLRLVAAPGAALGVGAALVRLVDDDEVPALAARRARGRRPAWRSRARR